MNALVTRHRSLHLDVLRIFAAFLVVFNHLPGYTLFAVSDGFKTFIYMFFTMVTRANVPLFLMISGALLLPRQESYGVLLKKRVLRCILVILLSNALVYGIWHTHNFSLKDLLSGTIKGSIQGSYWYLYSYLGMLILLPFLRKLAAGFDKQEFLYLLILRFILASLIPILTFVARKYFSISFSVSSSLQIVLATERTIFYPLTGYYLEHQIDIHNLSKRKLILIALGGLGGIVISCALTYLQGISSGFTQNYVMLFDYTTAIACFVLCKYFFAHCKKAPGATSPLGKLLALISSVTFGIYLFDPVLKKYLYSPINNALEPYFPTLLVSLCWCLVSMLICGAATWLLKKIPGIKKLL